MAKLQAKFERHEAGPGVGLLKKLGVQLESGTFVCEDTSALKSELQARGMFLTSFLLTRRISPNVFLLTSKDANN